MTITEWVDRIINGTGGLHAFEAREWAEPSDEALAAWVIRCLANPASEGSADVLAAIIARRDEAGDE